MVKEFLCIIYLKNMKIISEFIKGNGLMIRKMVLVFKSLLMDLYIMVIIKITNLMDEESLLIIKDKFMKDNGRMEQSKEKVFGKG